MKNFIITILTIVGFLCFFSDPQVKGGDDWFHEWCQSAVFGTVCLVTARIGYLTKNKKENEKEDDNCD